MIRLTEAQRLQIDDDRELVAQIDEADIIDARDVYEGQTWSIWKRPQAVARERPATMIAFEVTNRAELAEIQSIIDRVKKRAQHLESPQT
jgi:hypothetical protein